jgi:hypothetical protein
MDLHPYDIVCHETTRHDKPVLKLFLNAMIRNINIHNIFDIIENSKSIEPNKFTLKNL